MKYANAAALDVLNGSRHKDDGGAEREHERNGEKAPERIPARERPGGAVSAYETSIRGDIGVECNDAKQRLRRAHRNDGRGHPFECAATLADSAGPPAKQPVSGPEKDTCRNGAAISGLRNHDDASMPQDGVKHDPAGEQDRADPADREPAIPARRRRKRDGAIDGGAKAEKAEEGPRPGRNTAVWDGGTCYNEGNDKDGNHAVTSSAR